MRKYLLAISLLALISGSIYADNISVGTVQLVPGTSEEVSVSLNNSKQYAAFQFDLVLPEGVAVSSGNVDGLDVSLTDRKDNHVLRAAKIAADTYRILAYSPNNATISGSEGALIKLSLFAAEGVSGGEKAAKIESTVFVEADGKTADVDGLTFSIKVESDAEGQYAAGFEDKNKAADGYYYKSYFNTASATWFPADKFDVYSAVVSDNKVVMKPATAEDGYYKVKKHDGSNSKESVCIIRSSDKDAQYEIKGTGADVDKSTLPADNHLLIADGSQKGSKINFMFQLAKNKAGNVAFYRVTSGTFKVGSVYIDAIPFLSRAVDCLDIEIEGEATAINKVPAAAKTQDGAIYNLQGVRVNTAHKGIYIKNGKKYVIK